MYSLSLARSLSLSRSRARARSLSLSHTHELAHDTEFGNGILLELFTSSDIPASNFAPNDWALKVLLGHKPEVSTHFSFPLFPLVCHVCSRGLEFTH
jgi:hypothetical protein